MKFFALATILILAALPLLAQSTPPPNDGLHIDLSASYSLLNSTPTTSGKDSASATMFVARLPITDRWAGEYIRLNLPSNNANIDFGGVEYRRTLSDILKSKALRFDASKIQIFVYGGLGAKSQDNTRTPGFSAIAGGGFDKIVGNIAFRLVDLGYVRSAIGTGQSTGFFITNNEFKFSSGLALRF